MKAIKHSLLGCFLAGCVYSTGVMAQDQQSDSSLPQSVTENGITYMSGGIGDTEVKAMKSAAKDYDVMLTFATKEQGAYISDVKVDIEDSKGKNVVSTVSDGPIFLVDMPPGKYRITAETEGRTVTKNIQVSGRHLVKSSILWPQKLVQSPAPGSVSNANAGVGN